LKSALSFYALMTHRILILSNESLDILLLKSALEQDEEIQATVVATSGDLLEAMESDPVDMVLVDLDSPGSKGLQTVLDLRKAYPESCVLVLTAFASVPFIQEAMRAGACDCLIKPCRPEDLLDQVRKAIVRMEAEYNRTEAGRRELIRQLSASINHEVNNPLTAILGTAELLLSEKEGLSPKLCKDLQTIIDQSLRIREVMARLRDLQEIRTTRYTTLDTMLDLSIQDAPAPHVAPEPESFRRKVLVLDDNVLMISLLQRMFESQFDVHGCSSGEEALAALNSGQAPDVLLVDAFLPDTEGADFIRQVAPRFPSLPIIFLASHYEEERVSKAFESGATGLLYKPIDLEELRKIVLHGSVPPVIRISDLPSENLPKV
jgi:DNA-binding NtrC family response regulator